MAGRHRAPDGEPGRIGRDGPELIGDEAPNATPSPRGHRAAGAEQEPAADDDAEMQIREWIESHGSDPIARDLYRRLEDRLEEE